MSEFALVNENDKKNVCFICDINRVEFINKKKNLKIIYFSN